jgi:hypothetical protein
MTDLPDASLLYRGLARSFADADQVTLAEFPLPNGRRADLVAVDREGRITIVEIKTSRADLQADHKWPDYLDYCDRFAFAVPAGFALELLPAREGLFVADGFGAEPLRPATVRPLPAARRKAMLLRFARLAAARLQLLTDPRV